MCEMGEDLKFSEETIHHSIALFDRFFSIPQITEILASLSFCRNKTLEQNIQLVAVICMLISAKFLEKTYPGVHKLNSLINSPFEYDDFITME
jgi:hypothetical protein